MICHLSGCEVLSHYGFDLHFSDGWWCSASFHVLVGHSCTFFGEVPNSNLLPIFFLLCYYWVTILFYILNTSLCGVFCFVLFFGYMICKHFLPVYGLIFCFLDDVFWNVTVFNFDKVQSIKFFLYCLCVWYLRKKSKICLFLF